MREHRARLRAQGPRPIQIWVPDVHTPEFVAAAHNQSEVIAASEQEIDDQEFVEAISIDWDTDGGVARVTRGDIHIRPDRALLVFLGMAYLARHLPRSRC